MSLTETSWHDVQDTSTRRRKSISSREMQMTRWVSPVGLLQDPADSSEIRSGTQSAHYCLHSGVDYWRNELNLPPANCVVVVFKGSIDLAHQLFAGPGEPTGQDTQSEAIPINKLGIRHSWIPKQDIRVLAFDISWSSDSPRPSRRRRIASWAKPAPSPEMPTRTAAGAILDGLSDPDLDLPARRKLVLEAEITRFDQDQLRRLAGCLFEFISSYRQSNDPADLVAVASAIRTYVAIMDRGNLQAIATLLEPNDKIPVPIEIELELTKMVVRKLIANPPGREDDQPGLAERLMELPRAYLNARLLGREKYGAVALNAVLALLLLQNPHIPELLEILEKLEVAWFTQLLVRRIERIRKELADKESEEKYRCWLDCLQDVERHLAAQHQ